MNSDPRPQVVLAGLLNRPRAGLVAVLGCTALLVGCSAEYNDGLNKYPVRGQVQVDGEPAQGVIVRFFRDGKPGSTNADTPLAVTGEEGRFELSTNGDGDGAVEGDYRVTFTWKDGNSPAAKDRLGGRYTKLDKSDVTVTVRPEINDLEPFQLETSAPADGRPRPARRAKPNPNDPTARLKR